MPVDQSPQRPPHSRAPKPHTCDYIMYSVLLTVDFSCNLIPSASSAFRLPQKWLAHEGHSVVINFFLMNHLSSLDVRIGMDRELEDCHQSVMLPLGSSPPSHTMTSSKTKFLPNSSFFILRCLPQQFAYSSFLMVIEWIHE